MKLLLAIAILALAGCPDGSDHPGPPLYDYSVPEEALTMMSEASYIINSAAGCMLVGQEEPGPYINPILVVDQHHSGPNIIGCAWIGEALRRKEEPRNILIVRWTLEDEIGLTVLAHEIGHTLGLPHVSDPGIMYPSATNAHYWSEASAYRLRKLCDGDQEEPDESYIIDVAP